MGENLKVVDVGGSVPISYVEKVIIVVAKEINELVLKGFLSGPIIHISEEALKAVEGFDPPVEDLHGATEAMVYRYHAVWKPTKIEEEA